MAESRPQIERFASDLIEYVRDPAIDTLWTRISPSADGPSARRWREAGASRESEAMLRTVIPDVVDSTLFRLLDAIDNGRLRLIAVQDGEPIDLTEAGMAEMAGEYIGGEWRRRYSKQPVFG